MIPANQHFMLGLFAKRLDEIESLRKAEENRTRSLDQIDPTLPLSTINLY